MDLMIHFLWDLNFDFGDECTECLRGFLHDYDTVYEILNDIKTDFFLTSQDDHS